MTRTKPLTELRDADIRRVDAVKGAANGTRFLIAKAAAGEPGIVPAATVRDLIATTDNGARDTYLGDAGEILKAELSSADRKDLPDSEFAFVDAQGVGHYPINDAAHVRNALSRASAEINAGGAPAEIARKALPKIQAAARRLGIGESSDVQKESTVTTPAETVEPQAAAEPVEKAAPAVTTATTETSNSLATPLTIAYSLEAAQAIVKQAKIAKRAGRLAKQLAVAKAEAEGEDKTDGDAEPENEANSEVEKVAATQAGPISLKKAKAIAKAAKLSKRAARDELAATKARAVLAKLGRRNSTSDQAHIDGIDTHAAALGATAHRGLSGSETPVAELAKASDEQIDSVMDIIVKAMGPLLETNRTEIRAELTQVSEQLAKIGRIAAPGGPRAIIDRDGSIVPATDAERGLSFEQAALAKIASTFPVGSVERDAIEKAGAKSVIKDLMLARA